MKYTGPQPVPTIETERLRLRAHRVRDYENLVFMWSNRKVVQHIGYPNTREETWVKLLMHIGHWSLYGFGYWIIEEKRSGAFVGEMGFGRWRRELEPPLGDAPEIGWALIPEMHGKGYATEVALAAVAWADSQSIERTVSMIAPENGASIRVAEKCGYREYLRTIYRSKPVILFHRHPGGLLPD